MPEYVPNNWNEAYVAVTKRWPDVAWSKSQYCEHLQRVTCTACRHPTDVFIAGAAGYRHDSAWVNIDRDLRDEIVGRMRVYRTPTLDAEDYWSGALQKLMADHPEFEVDPVERERMGRDPARIIAYEGRASLRNFILTVAQRLARDAAARKRPKSGSLELQIAAASTGQECSAVLEESFQKVSEVLRAILPELSGDDRFLLGVVFVQGKTRRLAAEMLGWPDPSKATRRMQDVYQRIRAAFEEFGLDDANELDEGIVRAIKDFLIWMQDQIPAPSPPVSDDGH